MIAHHTRAPVGIGNHGDAIAYVQSFFRNDAMRYQPRDRIVRAGNFRQYLRFRVVVKRACVGNLAARLRINRGAIENYFARFASL